MDPRSSVETAEIRLHIKNLNLKMKNHIFDWVEPIRIFDFLTRFVNEADILNISEGQAFVALPTFLVGPAEAQYLTNRIGESRHGGVTCSSEAIQYLLRTCATPTAMCEALENLRSIRHRDDES